MKKRFITTITSIFCFALSHADIKLPPQCIAFEPEVLRINTILPLTEAEKLAKSKTFGQDIIPQSGKEYWNVYSDRAFNKVYSEPRRNTLPLGETLNLGEKLRIAKIENGFALVYHEPKTASIYPVISNQAKAIGWVPMENLLLWSKCPANEKGIYNKALITLKFDEIGRKKKEDLGKRYKNPDNLNLSEDVTTGMDFFFIMKQRPDGMVLLANTHSLAGTMGTALYGWVKSNTYVPWNQRSCIEPNWEINAVTNLKNEEIKVMSGNKVVTRFTFGEILSDDKGPNMYRMQADILRYPILDNDSGNDNLFKCTTFGLLGETLNSHLKKLGETNELKREKLANMTKLNMIFVIDGTQSMGKYFTAIKDAIKKGCEYLTNSSKENQYTPKVGLVIYRDYADGEKGLVEYIPMSEVNDVRLMEYLDNAGEYGAKSSSADRTNEEALYKGLEYALDTERMGYKKDESNLMMVIGDCGNDEKDTQCLSEEEILSKLVENRINLMTFQVRRNEATAWQLFQDQLRDLLINNVQNQYKKINAEQKVKWALDADGVDVKPTDGKTFYIASSRLPNDYGIDMKVEKLTSLMERSIGLFANAIAIQRASLNDAGGSLASDENAKIDSAFAVSILGLEEYQRLMRTRNFMAVTGYTEKTSPKGYDFWKPVIFISTDELTRLMERLAPVNRSANEGNRKEFVNALKALVQSMLPDITDEEMTMKGTGEIMALIAGLNVKSTALSGYRLIDIQDPTVVKEADFRALVRKFREKYKNLEGIKGDKNYKFTHESNGSKYYWIPVEQLP